MALITCPECKQAISNGAKSCPHCGYTPRRRKDRSGCIGVLFFFVVAALLIGNGIRSSNQRSQATASKPVVTTVVSATQRTLLVKNGDTFDWPDLTVYVNGAGTSFGAYKYELGQSVEAGRVIQIPLSEFAKGDERFDPQSKVVREVIVSVPGYNAPIIKFR